MTLPASGTISLSQVQAEFGGSNPISITEYYGAASSVPASGSISLSHFYGKSATAVYAFSPTYSSSVGGTAVASGGMPADYNPGIHGSVIWPTGQGVNGAGWVGTSFTATTSTMYFQIGADNTASVYIGSSSGTTLVGSLTDWNVWASGAFAATPGRQYTISVYVADGGGAYGCAGRIYDANGTNIVTTNGSWLSA